MLDTTICTIPPLVINVTWDVLVAHSRTPNCVSLSFDKLTLDGTGDVRLGAWSFLVLLQSVQQSSMKRGGRTAGSSSEMAQFPN